MCLAVPHRIEEVYDDGSAIATAGPIRRSIRIDALPDAKAGELVLVHAGFAIERVREEDAQELESLWDEIRQGAGDVGQLPF